MSFKTKVLSLISLLWIGACGYTMSPSPYGFVEPVTLSIPIISNASRFESLGPELTRYLIEKLDASPSISVRENGTAKLTVHIRSVIVSGGSWDRGSSAAAFSTRSASRVVSVSVEAVFTRPDPAGGQEPLVRRRLFSSSRSFLVDSNQSQVDLLQQQAFDWVLEDLSQTIAQNMFSEF